MTEHENIDQHAESAARSLVALVRVLQDRGVAYPLDAYRAYGYLTRCAGELRTAIELIEASVEKLRDNDRLRTDYRGEPLDEVLQRFLESSDAGKDQAGQLHSGLATAHSALGHVAYKETPDEQQSVMRS